MSLPMFQKYSPAGGVLPSKPARPPAIPERNSRNTGSRQVLYSFYTPDFGLSGANR